MQQTNYITNYQLLQRTVAMQQTNCITLLATVEDCSNVANQLYYLTSYSRGLQQCSKPIVLPYQLLQRTVVMQQTKCITLIATLEDCCNVANQLYYLTSYCSGLQQSSKLIILPITSYCSVLQWTVVDCSNVGNQLYYLTGYCRGLQQCSKLIILPITSYCRGLQ